jgi:hypothetical protein
VCSHYDHHHDEDPSRYADLGHRARPSGARERYQWSNVLAIGSLKSLNISGACFTHSEIGSTPTEPPSPLVRDQQISHQSREPPVSIGEWVNKDESMTKSNRKLIGRVGLLVEPDLAVEEARRQGRGLGWRERVGRGR